MFSLQLVGHAPTTRRRRSLGCSEVESIPLKSVEVIPSDKYQKILPAVEFYFSDEYISKDAFMFRHVTKGKDGYVNLKLVSSFRKVKNITKDWTVVRDAVKTSSMLCLNEKETRVRRIVPFMSNTNPLAKCILVYNLGKKPSMGTMEQQLGKFGTICKISIFSPGQSMPSEVRRQRSLLKIPASHPIAVVEFSTTEEANRIVETLSKRSDLSNLLVAPLPKDVSKKSGGKGSDSKGKTCSKISPLPETSCVCDVQNASPLANQVPRIEKPSLNGLARPEQTPGTLVQEGIRRLPLGPSGKGFQLLRRISPCSTPVSRVQRLLKTLAAPLSVHAQSKSSL